MNTSKRSWCVKGSFRQVLCRVSCGIARLLCQLTGSIPATIIATNLGGKQEVKMNLTENVPSDRSRSEASLRYDKLMQNRFFPTNPSDNVH
jgi:hypothetical protein